MKWILQSTRTLVTTLLIIVTLVTGVFTPSPAHTLQQEHGGSMKANCAVSCSSHGQLAAVNSQRLKEEDDTDPAPPPPFWPQDTINIELLYILPILFAVWIAYKKREILLTTQLRF